jgi:hypothetical protein
MLSKGDIKIAGMFWVHRIFNSKPGGDWGILARIQRTLNGETLRYDAQWVLLGNAPEPLTPASKTNKRNNAKILTLKAEEFLEEVNFYLTHTCMWFNGKVVRQEDGIPTGTEFSGFLAQWVLAYKL